MNKFKNIILLSLISLFFFSCEKDEIAIDSLQVFGEEFYYGEIVNVGMAVKTSNPDITDYFWECDAGQFLQRQGYSLNQWQAPKSAGRYKIKCTVTCGGGKQTRETEIYVSSFFFEKFDTNDGANALPTGWSQTSSTTQTRNQRMELQVATTGKESGELRYDLNTSNLFPPLSAKATVGIVGTSANTYNPKYPNTTASFPFVGKDNPCALSLTGRTPSATIAPSYFISELRLEWWPDNHILQEIKYLPLGGSENDSITISANEFDGMLRVQWTKRANIEEGIPQSQGWFGIPFTTNALKYGIEDAKEIGLSIDEDYVITIMVDENNIFRTDAIKNWRVNADNAIFSIRELKYIYPARTRVFLDNVYCYLNSQFGR